MRCAAGAVPEKARRSIADFMCPGLGQQSKTAARSCMAATDCAVALLSVTVLNAQLLPTSREGRGCSLPFDT